MNTTKPGQPDYTGPVRGWFCYIHHEIPLEWSEDIRERVQYIHTHKPATEHAMRFACLTAVPTERVPVPLHAARAAYDAAWDAYEDEIHALVAELVPDAPWNGRELVFPRMVPT
jgi:hypothetical protein